MKYRKLTIMAVALALLLSACTCAAPVQKAESAATGSRSITAQEGKELMEAGGVVVVDVRRPDEYEAGHIPGAINIPNETIAGAQPEALEDLDAALIVYCRSGVRSADAAAKLTAIGYTDVADMGGFLSWSYDTVTGSQPGSYGKSGS